jgi:hypothetical protein
MSTEQPRAVRYQVSFKVVWDDGESFYTAPVSNMSETGLYIETTMPLPVGHPITIIPLVDGDEGGVFELRGQVVRMTSDDEMPAGSIAVRFETLSPAALTDLRKILSRYSVG